MMKMTNTWFCDENLMKFAVLLDEYGELACHQNLSHLPFLILKIVSFRVLLKVVIVTNSNAVPYPPSKVPTCSWYVGS